MNHPPLRRPLLQSRRARAAMAALGAALTFAAPLAGPADLAAPATTQTPLTRERLLVHQGGRAEVLELRGGHRSRLLATTVVAVGVPPTAR